MLKFDLTVNKKPRCDFSLRGIRMTLFTIVVILHYCGNRHSAPLSKIVEGEADAKVKSCAVDNLFHFFINKFFIFQSYRQWRITLHPLDANRPNSVPTGRNIPLPILPAAVFRGQSPGKSADTVITAFFRLFFLI